MKFREYLKLNEGKVDIFTIEIPSTEVSIVKKYLDFNKINYTMGVGKKGKLFEIEDDGFENKKEIIMDLKNKKIKIISIN